MGKTLILISILHSFLWQVYNMRVEGPKPSIEPNPAFFAIEVVLIVDDGGGGIEDSPAEYALHLVERRKKDPI